MITQRICVGNATDRLQSGRSSEPRPGGRAKGLQTDGVMIYGKPRKRPRIPGGFFHLEEERSKTRVSGYGHGDHIRLVDEYGNVWRGTAERASDNSVVYRFRDGKGRSLTGVSDNLVVTLRDEKGNTWKGFVD
jgi:hypothetical protein